MKSIKNTTGLIGMIDPNIITLVFKMDTHIEFSNKRECRHYYVLKSVASSVKIVGESRWLRHQSLRKTAKSQI